MASQFSKDYCESIIVLRNTAGKMPAVRNSEQDPRSGAVGPLDRPIRGGIWPAYGIPFVAANLV